MSHLDTIAAVATPPGVGGVGVIRISGPAVAAIAEAILGRLPGPRKALLASFRDAVGQAIDQGIALYFPAPRSFTGEDVLELQGHGGLVVMDLLMQRCLALGARIAQPGEFSQRAFLNGKMDLSQAEAVADLIESGAAEAARLAMRTLQGEFSRRIHELVEGLIRLRMYVEAAIDFPEEEIDFLADPQVARDLSALIAAVEGVRASARTGALLRDGMTLVIAGRPNAGKSSLLNALAERDAAIVTEVPGTTRDVLRERIQIDGLPIHLIDTAGLRETQDPVEQEGVRRARGELHRADRILWVYDAREAPAPDQGLPSDIPLTLVRNKIDLRGETPAQTEREGWPEIGLCARTGDGLDRLHVHLKQSMGYAGEGQGEFLARRRHLDALDRALADLHAGQSAYTDSGSGELLADDLRRAQQALSEITGAFSSDDLLGAIFSSFCIGK